MYKIILLHANLLIKTFISWEYVVPLSKVCLMVNYSLEIQFYFLDNHLYCGTVTNNRSVWKKEPSEDVVFETNRIIQCIPRNQPIVYLRQQLSNMHSKLTNLHERAKLGLPEDKSVESTISHEEVINKFRSKKVM